MEVVKSELDGRDVIVDKLVKHAAVSLGIGATVVVLDLRAANNLAKALKKVASQVQREAHKR